MKKVLKYVPEKFRDQAMINLFGFFQVPMIFWIGPKVIKLSDEECRIEIKLNRRTKNHLNSMYFGVLSAGADIAGGLIAMKCIEESGKKVALSFKDFHADFLKRAEGDTIFVNTQGKEIKKFVDEVVRSGERMNMPLEILAYTPKYSTTEPVAKFVLTLSLKSK